MFKEFVLISTLFGFFFVGFMTPEMTLVINNPNGSQAIIQCSESLQNSLICAGVGGFIGLVYGLLSPIIVPITMIYLVNFYLVNVWHVSLF